MGFVLPVTSVIPAQIVNQGYPWSGDPALGLLPLVRDVKHEGKEMQGVDFGCLLARSSLSFS